MENEIWKQINGYEGLYEVSNLGNVRSVERRVWSRGFYITLKGKPKKQVIDKRGYCIVFLSKDGKEKTHRVHRLVANAFIQNPYNKPEIDHINTNKQDNRADNLKWVTPKENSENVISHKKQIDAWDDELKRKMIESRRSNGSKNAPIKVYQYTLEGEFVAEYPTIKDAKKALLTNNNIGKAVDREDKSSCGYLWRSKKEERPFYCGRMKYFKLQNIVQYDKNGNVVAEYKDVKEASKATGLHGACIRRSIYKDFTPKKYKFKLKDDS